MAKTKVKAGRPKLSAQAADRQARFERRQALHDLYGTGSGRKGKRA